MDKEVLKEMKKGSHKYDFSPAAKNEHYDYKDCILKEINAIGTDVKVGPRYKSQEGYNKPKEDRF